MAYTLNPQTQKYDIYITIPSPGIKGPQTKLVGSFETEVEASAALISAKKTLEIIQPRVPTNEEINRWIASKLSYPGL
jgi:hypothetical protein